MRQIVLDTETTGISAEQGHRIIEIGCVELIDRELTNKHYHVYLNPERKVDEGAFKVHGISDAFLSDKQKFTDIANEFMSFIDGAELIIHNAAFDVGFINAELKHCKWKNTLEDHCSVLDTLALARNKHPGQRNNLDILCKRYGVDNSNRQLHGALLDAEILAFVYLAMTGGQISMLDNLHDSEKTIQSQNTFKQSRDFQGVTISPSADELLAHEEFTKYIQTSSGINLFTYNSTEDA
jgi:DNA polymerase-3 subunit epsilon